MNMDNLTQAQRLQIASAENKGGKPQHYNGSVGTDSFIITFSDYIEHFTIYNSHGTQTLYVSFDEGTNWFTLLTKTSLTLKDISAKTITVKGSGASTTYEILYVL